VYGKDDLYFRFLKDNLKKFQKQKICSKCICVYRRRLKTFVYVPMPTARDRKLFLSKKLDNNVIIGLTDMQWRCIKKATDG